MKLRTTLLLAIFVPCLLPAQDVNWKTVKNNRHLVAAGLGGDYNFYYFASYGYVFGNPLIPVVIGTDFSVPFGEDLADDWKWRTSVQAGLWNRRNFSLSLKSSFVFRRYESSLAQMYNTGAEITLLAGYLRPGWGVMALGNYDASIATRIKHGWLKESYPEIRDGWYGATGGNFKFGARGNLSFRSWNTYLTAGKHFGRDFKDNPTFPFFTELSIQKQLGK